MGQALRYMVSQWFRPAAFLDDPLIPIHNSASEQSRHLR